MTDLDKAIAAAREALADHWEGATPKLTAEALRDLLAALDAARGEAVWQVSLPKSPDCWSDYDYETTANAVAKASGNKCREVRAVFLAPPAAAVPEGYALVPVEPTEAMLNAARDWSLKKYGQAVGNDGARGCYAAMLAAANKENNSG